MPGESVTLFTGQGGCQTGNAIWELFTAEHSIAPDGRKILADVPGNYGAESTFFQESSRGNMVPRSIFTDLENSVIDEIRVGHYRNLFHPNSLINGREDAANIFSRGYWSQGSVIIKDFMNRLRLVIEDCHSCQSVIGLHSCGGGSGSGFTALQFDEIMEHYPKICKIEASLFPVGVFSTNMVEPYNALLAAHCTMNNVDINFLWDNNALYSVASKMLGLHNPSYSQINRLTSQVFSSMTCCSRFGGPLTGHLVHYQTNLVPYPRIHFPITSYSPILEMQKFEREACSIRTITVPLFKNSSQFSSINVENGCFVSCCLIYRGQVSPSDVYKCLTQLKNDSRISFVDWCPTGVKVAICEMPPTIIPNSHLSASDKNVMLMSNSSSIAQSFEALLKKFSHLYCKRAFVHWYVGEGMEEGEFADAIANINTLVGDYNACFSSIGVTEERFENMKKMSETLEKGKKERTSMTSIKVSFKEVQDAPPRESTQGKGSIRQLVQEEILPEGEEEGEAPPEEEEEAPPEEEETLQPEELPEKEESEADETSQENPTREEETGEEPEEELEQE